MGWPPLGTRAVGCALACAEGGGSRCKAYAGLCRASSCGTFMALPHQAQHRQTAQNQAACRAVESSVQHSITASSIRRDPYSGHGGDSLRQKPCIQLSPHLPYCACSLQLNARAPAPKNLVHQWRCGIATSRGVTVGATNDVLG